MSGSSTKQKKAHFRGRSNPEILFLFLIINIKIIKDTIIIPDDLTAEQKWRLDIIEINLRFMIFL